MMLEDLKPPTAKRSCKVGVIAATLTDKDREILFRAISDTENWPIKALSRALGERGLIISDSPLNNHRAKACVCFA